MIIAFLLIIVAAFVIGIAIGLCYQGLRNYTHPAMTSEQPPKFLPPGLHCVMCRNSITDDDPVQLSMEVSGLPVTGHICTACVES